MSDVKRYRLVHDPEYQSQMLVRPEGKYVLHSDYAKLEARLAEVEATLAKAQVALSEIQRWLPKHIAGEIARKTLALIAQQEPTT